MRSLPALATALADDITIVLSGCRWFSVLSSSTTHSLAARSPFIAKDFAQLTGANYLIYGFIVERGNNRTLTIELADADPSTVYISGRRTCCFS